MMSSEVWAGKVDPYYNVVTEKAICLGTIEFNSLAEAFVKTIRLYNKNARKHLYDPQFIFRGKVYICSGIGLQSKTGRGYTNYWTTGKISASKMPVTWGMKWKWIEEYALWIPKSKVNERDAVKYVTRTF